MPVSTLQFVRERLNEPGVSLSDVAAATGISRRSLQMLRSEGVDNAWTENVEKLARHFGFRFEPVRIGQEQGPAVAAVARRETAA
jgi:predicted transcriptional regulator